MRTLNPAERQAYADQGYVVVPGLIGADEAGRLDAEVERLGRVGNPAAPQGWIFALHQQESALCADFAHDERVLTLVGALVSPGIGLHSSKLVTKMPRSDEVCHWHRSDPAWAQVRRRRRFGGLRRRDQSGAPAGRPGRVRAPGSLQ